MSEEARVSKPWRFSGLDVLGHAMILAGKMTHADTVHFHAGHEPGEILLTGLWRRNPRYGECFASAPVVLDALERIGATRDKNEVAQLVKIWWPDLVL